MKFSHRNAAQTFQRFMDGVLWGMPWVVVYIDNILVASKDHAEHAETLHQLFARLQHYGLKIHHSKCVLRKNHLELL